MLKFNIIKNKEDFEMEENLNTSHVKVQRYHSLSVLHSSFHLNTSHVKVQPRSCSRRACIDLI